MKIGKMITKWNGYVPIVEDTPEQTSLQGKIEILMFLVWKIGKAGKPKKEGTEA